MERNEAGEGGRGAGESQPPAATVERSWLTLSSNAPRTACLPEKCR